MINQTIDLSYSISVTPTPTEAMIDDLGRTTGVSFVGHRTPGNYSGGNELYHLNLDINDPTETGLDADHPYWLQVEPWHPDPMWAAREVFRRMKEADRHRVVLFANYRTVDSTHYPMDEP